MNHEYVSKDNLLTKWKRFEFVNIQMFNRKTEFSLRNKYIDVVKKRKQIKPITQTSFDDQQNDDF